MIIRFEKINKWGDVMATTEVDSSELPEPLQSLLPTHEEELVELHLFQIG